MAKQPVACTNVIESLNLSEEIVVLETPFPDVDGNEFEKCYKTVKEKSLNELKNVLENVETRVKSATDDEQVKTKSEQAQSEIIQIRIESEIYFQRQQTGQLLNLLLYAEDRRDKYNNWLYFRDAKKEEEEEDTKMITEENDATDGVISDSFEKQVEKLKNKRKKITSKHKGNLYDYIIFVLEGATTFTEIIETSATVIKHILEVL